MSNVKVANSLCRSHGRLHSKSRLGASKCNYGINSSTTRGDTFAEFYERNGLRIISTFLRKLSNWKWMSKSANREISIERELILSADCTIVQDVEVLVGGNEPSK